MRCAPAAAAEDEHRGRRRGRPNSCERVRAVADSMRARTGLPVTLRWSLRLKKTRASTNDRWTSSAMRASQRLASPGMRSAPGAAAAGRSSQAASATGPLT